MVFLEIEELNEEDQQLKNELEMLVERLHVRWLVPCVDLKPGMNTDTAPCRNRIHRCTSQLSKLSKPSSRPLPRL